VAWSLAADFRRARIWLLRTVFRIQKAGLPCQERFPFSPVTFVPDNGSQYIHRQVKSLFFSRSSIHLSTDSRNCLPDKANGGE